MDEWTDESRRILLIRSLLMHGQASRNDDFNCVVRLRSSTSPRIFKKLTI